MQLTDTQKKLLGKGLTFVPTNRTTKQNAFRADLAQYHRRLKLYTYFGPTPPPQKRPFYTTSNWEPANQKLPKSLTDLIQQDQASIEQLKIKEEKSNLTVEEEQALHNLKKRTDIIVKPADKGSAMVLMDRTDYEKEALRQLQNTEYYKPLSEPIKEITTNRIASILKTLQQRRFLTKTECTYLMGQAPYRTRLFYTLPKIHKEQKHWINNIPPGRPIVSDCGSESYGIAEYLDHFLSPLANKHPSYIKNTTDFIQKVRQTKAKEPFKLFTMDVRSLYTNIDTSKGMQTIEKWLKKYPETDRPDNTLLQLLHLSLTTNDFQFNGKYYLQIKGTAMGKRFAPAYANIYMAEWEETAFSKCKNLPIKYYRYLDDIWGIWTHTDEEFDEFVKTLNEHHESIKLDPILKENEVNFLDTTVFKGPQFKKTGILDTRVYFKPTDTHALLHKKSFHPQHTFKGLLKSQLLRFDRICNNQTDKENATRTLFEKLRKRGYSRTFLRQNRKITNPQNTKSTTLNNQNIIPLISTYSSYAVRANKEIKENFNKTLSGTTIPERCKIISAYKKNPSLKDILVRAKLQPRKDTPQKTRSKKRKQRSYQENLTVIQDRHSRK